MKRKGSITIIALFIINIVFISSILLIYISTLQVSIATATLDSIQSKYMAEHNLNILIYNEEKFRQYLFYNILNGCRNERIPIDGVWNIDCTEDEDLNKFIQSTSHTMENIDNKKNIILDISTRYKDTPSNIKAHIRVVHELFELGEPYIFINDLPQEYRNKLIDLLDEIHTNCFDYDCRLTASVRRINNIDDSVSIKINPKDPNREIIINNGNESLIFSNKYITLVNLLRKDKEKPSFTIGNLGDDDLLKFNGVIYVEGDLIVNQKLEFDGVIIVNKGQVIINTDTPPVIKGMILHSDDMRISNEDLILVHNQDNIWRFGSYVPGFIVPRLNLIKRY